MTQFKWGLLGRREEWPKWFSPLGWQLVDCPHWSDLAEEYGYTPQYGYSGTEAEVAEAIKTSREKSAYFVAIKHSSPPAQQG
mmetsp:Transcript_8671/g.14966  ORF Transcript_8671/g.14966 Transcript_8671/m.14966 type:complete len:82 (+) Transcript_8671:921-1166(+)